MACCGILVRLMTMADDLSRKAAFHHNLLPVQISVNPTYHMIGKHAHNVGKDVISVDKTGKVKFNADQT